MRALFVLLVFVIVGFLGACGKTPTAPELICGPYYWVTDTMWDNSDPTHTKFILVSQRKGGCVVRNSR